VTAGISADDVVEEGRVEVLQSHRAVDHFMFAHAVEEIVLDGCH